MQCHFCGGEMKKGKTTYTLNRSGYHLLIDEVPAWICAQCNEVYFEENAVDSVQEMIKKLDIQVNVEDDRCSHAREGNKYQKSYAKYLNT